MRRLRVGWLAPEDSFLPPGPLSGSVTTAVWQLATRLTDSCDVVVATREHPQLGEAEHVLDGIRFVRHRPGDDERRGARIEILNKVERKLRLPDLPYVGRDSYYRGYARALGAALRRADVDVVHLYNVSQWLPLLREALPRTPLVIQMHCEWLAEIPRAEGVRRLAAADRVLAVSEQIADQIRERFPEYASIVEVHPNGVDLDGFRPAAALRAERADELAALRTRLGLDGGPVVLFVGRISAEKGLHTLVEAFPAVLAQVPDAQLVLAGEWAGLRSPLPTRERRELRDPAWRTRYVDHLRALAEPFADRFHLTGALPSDDVTLALALADVYAQPSVFEAFGLPVVEAMATGIPVVASDGGALPELVDDGRTGLVVPTGDAPALAAALVRVLREPGLAARFGDAGRELAARTLGWDASVTRLLGIYSELVSPGAPNRADALPAS